MKIYSRDLAKMSDTTKCRKPCFYKKYSLVGEEQPNQIVKLTMSMAISYSHCTALAAMQDSTEVTNFIRAKNRHKIREILSLRWRKSC